MKQKWKSLLFTSFLLLILTGMPRLVHAQIINPGCDPLDPTCPIDGGLVLLLATGVGYGIIKFMFTHKKEIIKTQG